MKLTVMSFNTQHCMNYISRQIEFDCFVEAIQACNADIIGLQEMRGQGEHPDYAAQVQILAERLGYHYYFAKAIDFNGVNPYGNGLLSRYPIFSAKTVLIPDPEVKVYSGYYETRCILKAKIDVPGGLNIIATHFGLNPDEQVSAVQTIIANLPEERGVLMGDFNLRPNDRILKPIQNRLFDTAALFTEEKLSFPSDNPNRKIDYIFTTSDLKVTAADIPALVVSDHRPHTAVIEV